MKEQQQQKQNCAMSTHAIPTNILYYVFCYGCGSCITFLFLKLWVDLVRSLHFIASNPSILYYLYGHLRAKACRVKWTLNGYFICNLMMCHWDFRWYSPSENLLQFLFFFSFSFLSSIKCSLKSSLDIYRKLMHVLCSCSRVEYKIECWAHFMC